MFLRTVGDNLDQQLAVARSIEFAEENSLPGAQDKASIFNEYHLACPCEHRFRVRIGVSLPMPIRTLVRDQSIQHASHVMGHIRVSVLVDGDTRGGMRHIDVADAGCHAGFLDGAPHLVRDVNELRAAVGSNMQGFQVSTVWRSIMCS